MAVWLFRHVQVDFQCIRQAQAIGALPQPDTAQTDSPGTVITYLGWEERLGACMTFSGIVQIPPKRQELGLDRNLRTGDLLRKVPC